MNHNSEKIIYDVGMHIGNDTAYYLDRGYKVIAVEANPVLADEGKIRFSNVIKEGRLIIINKGISSEQGSINFWVNETNSEWSSFNKELGMRNGTTTRKILVDTISMDTLFKEYGIPYYLKIDIEGNDQYCIESIDPAAKPLYVSCEAGDVLLLDILYSKGYTKFKMINQANGFREYSYWEEKFFIPSLLRKILWKIKKKLYGKTLSSFATSGPFGEDTYGEWKEYDIIKKEYRTYYKGGGVPINKLSWYDFHATY